MTPPPHTYFAAGDTSVGFTPEKGGKEHEMPAHHQIEETIDEYLSKVSIDERIQL